MLAKERRSQRSSTSSVPRQARNVPRQAQFLDKLGMFLGELGIFSRRSQRSGARSVPRQARNVPRRTRNSFLASLGMFLGKLGMFLDKLGMTRSFLRWGQISRFARNDCRKIFPLPLLKIVIPNGARNKNFNTSLLRSERCEKHLFTTHASLFFQQMHSGRRL